MSGRFPILVLSLLLGLLVSWWMVNDARVRNLEDELSDARKDSSTLAANAVPISSQRPKSTRSSRAFDRDASSQGALPNERLATFKNDKDYQDFLAKLARLGLRNLGQIDSLRSVRFGFDDLAQLNGLGLDEEDLQFNFPRSLPLRPDVESQPNAVGFGRSALEFIGVRGDNSQWGKGVTIAVIDSGIEPHLTLRDDIRRINIVELGEGAEPNNHGTAVASIIGGQDPRLRGLAPEADLISVRVVDETGFSNAFAIAQGIVEATLAGADILNISLGGEQPSLIVQQAIQDAAAAGIAIVASSGNDGLPNASFPAGYPEVISVGAVDAVGDYLNFSNRDTELSLTAPGLGVFAAIDDASAFEFSGTSASAPFVAAALAVIISESDTPVNAQQASETLLDFTNDAGPGGNDPSHGAGILNIGRVLNQNTPGILDLAVSSQVLLTPEDTGGAAGLQVNIENRGTEPLVNPALSVSLGGQNLDLFVGQIRANERKDFFIPLGQSAFANDGSLRPISSLSLPDNERDANPADNLRQDVILADSDAR